MKKNLFILALCAISTCFLASCGGTTGGEDVDTNVKIELSQTTLSLSVGSSSERLIAKVTPAGTNVNVVWSSDNEAVATVRSGVVTGVAEGTANIIAAVGDVKAVCVVTVSNDAVLDNFAFNDWGLFGDAPSMIAGTDTILKFSFGEARCQLGTILMRVWDNGLTFVDGSGFSGIGITAAFEVPFYWIMEGDYAGYYVGNQNGVMIAPTTADNVPYTAKSGALIDEQKYGEFFKQVAAYESDTTQEVNADLYAEAFEGVQLFYLSANNGQYRNSYYLGNISRAQFVEEEGEEEDTEIKLYAAQIEWLDFFSADRYYGLKAVKDDEGYLKSVVEPFDVRRIVKTYTNVEDTGAEVVSTTDSKYFLGDMKRVHTMDKLGTKQMGTLNLYKK